MEKVNLEILRLLYKKRLHILIITIAGAALGVLFSTPMFITPKFKSTGIVYPANISPVSDETPTEQLMQYFNSYEVKDALRKRFNLGEHYGLDSTDGKFETYYSYYFDENFKISQTRFESIQIEVLDTDPKMAQQLVYGLIDAVNDHIRKSINDKTEEFVAMHQQYVNDKRKKMDSIESILRWMSKEYGIIDFQSQIEQVSKSYYRAMAGGSTGKLDQMMQNLGNKGVMYLNLLEQYKADLVFLNESRQHIDKGLNDIKKKFTYTTISSKPNLPEIKATPKRSIIVFITTIGALLFSCLFFIVSAKIKDIKQHLD